MIKFFLIAAILLCGFSNCSSQQKSIKIYGYRQAVSAGARPGQSVDEQGNTHPLPPKSHINYFIYLSYPAGLPVLPLEVWIEGKQYGAGTESLPSPVEFTYQGIPAYSQKIILVPKTSNKVLQLIPIEKAGANQKPVAKPLIKENELVITYKLNGKVYGKGLKKFTALRTAVMQ